MGHDEMKMEMIQCLTTFGVNETYDSIEVDESDGLVPDTFNDSTDDLKSGIQRGLADIDTGRVLFQDDFKLKLGLSSQFKLLVPREMEFLT